MRINYIFEMDKEEDVVEEAIYRKAFKYKNAIEEFSAWISRFTMDNMGSCPRSYDQDTCQHIRNMFFQIVSGHEAQPDL